MLQRNFQIDNNQLHGGNVSEASASTATVDDGDSQAIDVDIIEMPKFKTNFSINNSGPKRPQRRRQRQGNVKVENPNELDMLMLKSTDWNESDSGSS